MGGELGCVELKADGSTERDGSVVVEARSDISTSYDSKDDEENSRLLLSFVLEGCRSGAV